MGNGGPSPTPTDPNATANNHGSSGPNGKQPGINATSTGNNHATAINFFSEARNLNWIKVKGSKLEYGLAARFEIVLGVKNTLIAGFKTALDIAWNRTYNLSSYTTWFGGARYEAIRPKKIEVVYGSKKDEASMPKKERVNGAWTHTSAAKEKKNQALFKAVVDELMEQSGTTLEKVIKKYDAKWTKVEENAKSLTEKCDALTEKLAHLNFTVTNYKKNIDQISDVCKQFQLKSAQMEIAADSAISIKADKKSIKGSTVSMKAGTIKFMGDLVKLGE
jgi:hypothetical protein